ncbi:MAG: hypothetical protein ACI9F9_002146, partial [Candidatus Paceibacteria bacterium]
MDSPHAETPPPTHDLGRRWMGPAALLAGAATLLRVKVLADLAGQVRGVPHGWSTWSVLGEWPAELIQAGILCAVACVLVFGVGGWRRAVGTLIALGLVASAITGWPFLNPLDGNPLQVLPPVQLALWVTAGTLWIPLLAWGAEHSRLVGRLLSSRTIIALCILASLGSSATILWKRSENAPLMDVRHVLPSPGTH